jgi:hypothetical protein
MEWLFSWELSSWLVGGFVATAFAFLGFDSFKPAKLCFLLATTDAIGGIAMWGAKWTLPMWASSLGVIAMSGAIGFLALLSFRYVDQRKELKEQKPTVTVRINSRIVGNLYTRVVAPPPGQTVNGLPSFQEIFYEWSVTLTADRQSVASLKVDNIQENDIYRVEPEGATTEKVPETPLGFKTSGASKPSHYALMVKSDDLTESQSLTVTIRRPITTVLVDSDLITLAYVRSATSKVAQSISDEKVTVERLKRQAKVIAEWKYPPQTTPLPIHPPGEIPQGVMQSSLEVWCKDEECKEMIMGGLVAEWNKVSPKISN